MKITLIKFWILAVVTALVAIYIVEVSGIMHDQDECQQLQKRIENHSEITTETLKH